MSIPITFSKCAAAHPNPLGHSIFHHYYHSFPKAGEVQHLIHNVSLTNLSPLSSPQEVVSMVFSTREL